MGRVITSHKTRGQREASSACTTSINLNGEQKRSGVVDLSVVESIVGGQLAAEGDQLPALQRTRDALLFR